MADLGLWRCLVQYTDKWYPGKKLLGKEHHEEKLAEQSKDLQEAQVTILVARPHPSKTEDIVSLVSNKNVDKRKLLYMLYMAVFLSLSLRCDSLMAAETFYLFFSLRESNVILCGGDRFS